MTLFPEALLHDLRRLPGGGHSFARQVADDEGDQVRARLDAIAERVGPAVAARWAEVLSSLDNRRFFQGFAEVATAGLLLEHGWGLPDLAWPGPGLLLQSPDGRAFHGLVLSFIRQVRPAADEASIERLRSALSRVGARSRVGLVIHRWLPHDFDPEPVRQAVELWLREVERGAWSGRYAAYEDENISIEFALTGSTASKTGSVLAFALGPFQAHRVLEAVGRRMVGELDRMRVQGCTDPVLVCCVADQPWRVPQGYLRELLYGRPVWQTASGPSSLESAFSSSDAPSLYRDPLYRSVAGVLFLERPVEQPDRVTGHGHLNPWASMPVQVSDFPVPSFGVSAYEDDLAVMRWFDASMEGVGSGSGG